MYEELTTGSILLANGTVTPRGISITTEAYSPGWNVVKDVTRQNLGKAIESAGWTFFFLAAAIQKRRFGFDTHKSVHGAVKRILVRMDAGHLNCLEIESVKQSSFLGLPYVTVSAHVRHI